MTDVSGTNKARPQHDESHAPEQEKIAPHKAAMAMVVAAIALVVLAVVGYLDRRHDDKVLAADTVKYAAPTVEVARAKQAPPVDNFVLPGNVTAYIDSPIYARTDGYLTHWYFDIGARVKKGDLLAEIATPELDQQLAQAEADLTTAETNAGNAKAQAERYKGLVQSDAVSKFDTDTFVTQAASTSSAVKSAQANVQRLKELQSFEKIYAPFDGAVTARNVDTGQLISQGGAAELFHLQALGTLRVYTNVPQIYSAAMKRGTKIPLTFPEYPGKTFVGTLVRTADAIDPASRTLLVEVDVDNRGGQLMPGSLAQVHFKTSQSVSTFIVPTSALIFRREGLQIGTVVESKDGAVAHLASITIGEDDGATAEVISGLTANDQVIQDPPDSIIEGEKVTVVKPGSSGAANTGGK
jgi:RND family efflux transporter MFP subunit